MKKGWVITIGREFCSGGAEVARKVAERLNIPYYDRDLIDHAAERTNLSREVVEQHEEKAKAYLRGAGMLGMGDPYGGSYIYRDDPSLVLPIHTRIYEAQCDAIRRLAEKPCVIVGRCADYVLGECSNVLDVISIFVRADMDKRVQRCMRLYLRNEADAKKLIQKTDKIRSKYYSAHTQRDWGAIGNYTLIVDTGEFGTDGAAALIEAAVKELIQRDEIVL